MFFCSDPDRRGCVMVTLAETKYDAYGKGWRFGTGTDWRAIGAPVCQDCRLAAVREQVAADRAARELVSHGA